MSQSVDIQIVDLIVSALDAAKSDWPDPFANSITIERKLLPRYEPDSLREARVAVAPRAQSRDLVSRAATSREHMVQIAPHWFPKITDGAIMKTTCRRFAT